MKIAYLTTRYPSVSHTFIRREIREIERRGHEIIRVALRPSESTLKDKADIEEEKKTIYCLRQPLIIHIISFLEIIVLHPLKFFAALKIGISMGRRSHRGLAVHFAYILEACTIARILKREKADHVHVHFGTNVTAIARLVKACGGPGYSFTVHGPDELDSAIGFDLSGKIDDARFVIAITDFCAAQLMRFSSFENWKKIHKVRCMVGNDFFRERSPVQAQSKDFVCIGRLSPQKGQMILIEAFKEVFNIDPEVRLILVGDGELRKPIEEKISREKLSEAVIITGYVSEEKVRDYLKGCRAMVLPSFAEGLPMVIMEAFALGRPVISTFIAGIPELVNDRENGWLIPSGNVPELSRAMISSLKMTDRELNEYARKGFEKTFSNHFTTTEGERLEKLFIDYAATGSNV